MANVHFPLNQYKTCSITLVYRHMVIIVLVGLIALGVMCVPKVIGRVKATVWWISIVESERIAVGQWVKQHSLPGDTLFAGHGHIAREAQIYTIDSTGLNSKVTTDYECNGNQLVTVLQPNWIATPGLISPDLQVQGRYVLRESFYNISWKIDYATWRIYERARGEESRIDIARPIGKIATRTDGTIHSRGYLSIEGGQVVFEGFSSVPSLTRFTVGLVKEPYPVSITAFVYGTDRALLREEQVLLEKEDVEDWVNGYTQEWAIELDPNWQVDEIVIVARVASSGQYAKVTLVDPVYFQMIDLAN